MTQQQIPHWAQFPYIIHLSWQRISVGSILLKVYTKAGKIISRKDMEM